MLVDSQVNQGVAQLRENISPSKQPAAAAHSSLISTVEIEVIHAHSP